MNNEYYMQQFGELKSVIFVKKRIAERITNWNNLTDKQRKRLLSDIKRKAIIIA